MNSLFKNKKTIIGMIHVAPLPGTPKYCNDFSEVISKAKAEALIYKKAGIDMIAIENMHDVPYLNQNVGPEITASMAVVAYEVKNATDLPCGIQILAGANKEAMAVAEASGLDFLRVEGFIFAHVADEGIIQGCAGELLRYRKQIGADNIHIFTDIKKKHSSHSITDDLDITEIAKGAEFFLSDGVIITGMGTGEAADLKEIEQVKSNVSIPVIVGSGINIWNVDRYLNIADSLIVGSYFKERGHWTGKVEFDRVKKFMDRVNELRNK